MNKALIVTSVASMVDQFLLPSMFLLQNMGYEVSVACNFEKGSTCSADRVDQLKSILNDRKIPFFHIDFERNVLRIFKNRNAYKQLLDIVSDNEFSLIHCHSPIGGLLGRLAARKTEAQVFYTAHGFHFYKGAPLKNWLCYYPVEKICSHFTDNLITINKEDYELAKSKFKAGAAHYLPGVGVDLLRFKDVQVDRNAKRQEIGVPEDAFLMLSVGELNDNKNHQVIIKALAKLNNPDVHYAIAGVGDKKEYLISLANELGVAEQLHLLGYRNDIPELNHISDLCCFPSIREGLGLAPLESMVCGLPVVAAENRGTREFVINGENGFLCKYDDVDGFTNSIAKVIDDTELREKLSNQAVISVKKFHLENVLNVLRDIYKENI